MEKDTIQKLSKKYGKSEQLIQLLLKICEDNNLRNAFQYIVVELENSLKRK